LLEPQRTNLALYSADFSDSTWSKLRTVVTTNTTSSPSNVLNADTIEVTSAGQAYLSQGITTTNTSLSVSIYCKYINQQFIQIYSSSSGIAYANFDIQNGVVGSNGANASNIQITSAANGFYRLSLTFVVPVAAINIRFAFVSSSTSGYNPPDGISGRQFYAWGAQFELGAFATSYIPTSSATVTRNQDTFTLSNVFTNNMISSAGGTWFMELRNNLSLVRDASANGLYLTDATALAFGFRIKTYAPNNRLAISKVVASTETPIYTTLTDTAKVAIKWNGTTADLFVNGVKVVAATSFTSTAMEVIATNVSVPIYLNDTALYNTPISDAECIAITTL
jgi:hypothetical protein